MEIKINKTGVVILFVLSSFLFIWYNSTKKREKVPQNAPMEQIEYKIEPIVTHPLPRDKIIVLKETKMLFKTRVVKKDSIMYVDVDSAAIVEEYLRKHTYDDTIVKNKLGYIRLIEDVQYNKITKRQVYPFFTQPKQKVKRRFLLGAEIYGNLNMFDATINCIYIDRLHNGFGLSYSPFSKAIGISYYYAF